MRPKTIEVAAGIIVALAAAALAPAAARANHSVFERVSAGAINGNGAFESSFEGASADGTRVFFETYERLVREDKDAYQDIYERSGGTTTRVSAGQTGGSYAFHADFLGASTDGTRVFFGTRERLVSGDTDNSADIYERSGGTTKLVSAGATGVESFDALFRGASADGTRVFFETPERLVWGDTDYSADVYERSGRTTTLVSTGADQGGRVFDAVFGGASADGTRVFFETPERLVSGDTEWENVDVYERSGGTTKLVSTGATGGNDAFDALFRGASADGRRVFFVTRERLVSGDTDGDSDVYERSPADTSKLVTTKLVSTGATSGFRSGVFPDASFVGASADGRRVFFQTCDRLVSADTDSRFDIYERSGGTTKRVSAGATGGNGVFDASFRRASADGTRVFFDTSERLVRGDTDNSVDIYERSGGATKRVSAGAINSNGAFWAFFKGASRDGTRVFFSTWERLASGDTDDDFDVYERSAGHTTLVSQGQINGNGAFGASMRGASTDGTRVFFETFERLVSGDTDGDRDVYAARVP